MHEERVRHMKYHLEWCAWELTRQCNMNCDICLCGTDRGDSREELTHEEAMDICRQLGDMQIQSVVLTGGEPLLRKDWPEIASALTERNIEVEMITNGYLVTGELLKEMKESGIQQLSISIDGTRKIHDEIRMKGSYDRCERAISLLHKASMTPFIVTTVTKDNLHDLSGLKRELRRMKVHDWCIQVGLPLGNMPKERVLSVDEVEELVELCYEMSREGDIRIHLGENIGYYSCKEALIRSRAAGTEKIPVFTGCPGGITSMQICFDGSIVQASLCSRRTSEGNLRERSLQEIWEDPQCFTRRRNMTAQDLKGVCAGCEYGSICLGGCPAVRYSLMGDLYGENRMCIYGKQRVR